MVGRDPTKPSRILGRKFLGQKFCFSTEGAENFFLRWCCGEGLPSHEALPYTPARLIPHNQKMKNYPPKRFMRLFTCFFLYRLVELEQEKLWWENSGQNLPRFFCAFFKDLARISHVSLKKNPISSRERPKKFYSPLRARSSNVFLPPKSSVQKMC